MTEPTSPLRPEPEPAERLTAGDIALAGGLLAVLVIATFLKLAKADQTIGFAVALAALSIAPPLVLSAIEHVTRPAGPRKPARTWWLHIQIMLANYAAGVPLGILAAKLAEVIVHGLGIQLGIFDLRFVTSGSLIALIAAFCFSLFLGDFFFYWYHWACHKSKFLWQHHKMHHMDPHFDALTGPRQNWLEGLLGGLLNFIPMTILFRLDGADPFSLGLVQGIILGVTQGLVFINHSNLRLQFGRASVLAVSSQFHRIHHSYLPPHIDKNYAAFFPFWDLIFGTYYHPKRDEFPPTGVLREREIRSVWEVQIFPLREGWKYLRHGPRWSYDTADEAPREPEANPT